MAGIYRDFCQFPSQELLLLLIGCLEHRLVEIQRLYSKVKPTEAYALEALTVLRELLSRGMYLVKQGWGELALREVLQNPVIPSRFYAKVVFGKGEDFIGLLLSLAHKVEYHHTSLVACFGIVQCRYSQVQGFLYIINGHRP